MKGSLNLIVMGLILMVLASFFPLREKSYEDSYKFDGPSKRKPTIGMMSLVFLEVAPTGYEVMENEIYDKWRKELISKSEANTAANCDSVFALNDCKLMEIIHR